MEPKLMAAIRKLEAHHKESIEGLAKLEEQLPLVLAGWALGDFSDGDLSEHRTAIVQLRQIVSYPWQEATEPLTARLKAIRLERQRKQGAVQAVTAEQAFRKTFNQLRMTPADNPLWERAREEARGPEHHRAVEALERFWSHFQMADYHFKPGSPSFDEYCNSNGLPAMDTNIQ
ncbi:hypothetical protein [Geobacter sp. AOG1]|uniref:hypothetical protein n=1 Tax=Geobacter sp. AOG1 TaxID=1566346 RepID=UPI001CC80DB0|nr:hypothetical protein [Geobacter sp. AOG1]GFE56405.1 hypothetical protein AOG1_02840 [Geobacter sp. AOG1]